MSAIGVQSQINKDRALWLSSIPSDVIHGNIICDTIIANAGYISTFYSDNAQISTLQASSFQVTDGLDVSTINTSSFYANFGKTSTLQWASDLSGGVGYVNITTDASGVAVDGDPIKFNNLVYFTSTITLVPVSTIVDTDIFACNAYTSTLSSGSISTNLLQVNQGLFSSLQGDYGSFNRLFVSSLEALDISGVDGAKYWSQYPTLNSSITFQPTYVLSNVNNKLYFAGTELTDSSGGGIDWSYFPAQQDVSMNDFSIRALSTLQYQDGGKLYSLTGNNLFYNGQPVQYGNASNVSQWANFPAVNTIQTAGYNISSSGNLFMTANSNIRMTGNLFSTIIDQGANIASYADINLVAQNGNKGRINMTANGGFNNGVFGEINLTANGGSVGGVGTGGLVTINANTPTGTPCNLTSAIKLNASGINSYAGAIPSVGSLAGYNFIYGQGGVNICAGIPSIFPNVPLTTFIYGTAGVEIPSNIYTLDIQPYWDGVSASNGDLNIHGRIENLTNPNYVNLSNVKHIYMDGIYADIQNAKYISSVSSVQNTAYVQSLTQTSSILWNQAIGVSSVLGALQVNNVQLFQNISGVGANSRIDGISSIKSFNMSTTDFWVSSINGKPIDASGGSIINTDVFSTLFTSSLRVSSLVGYSPTANTLSTIFVEGGFQFRGDYQGQAFSGRFLSSLRNINSAGEVLTIEGGGTGKEFALLYPGNTADPWKYVRIGGGSAFDTKIRNDSVGFGEVSTSHLLTSTIIGNPTAGLDISGYVHLNNDIEITDGHAVGFTSGEGYTRLERRDIATNNMLSATNYAGLASNNMAPLAVGELWFGGGADEYQACRLYSVFPYGNYELDAIDADGATLFAYMQGYENGAGLNPGFLQAYSNVSSISGYDQESATNQMLHVINGITTSNLIVSSINGQQFSGGGGGSVVSSYTDLYTSSFAFSTATSVGSNAGLNYPIFIDWDQANGGANANVAIAVQGHNYATGAVVNRIEMGCRGNGENYIMSVWPGQNLEDLAIDATQVTIRDTDGFSTIINENPFGIATNGVAKIGAGSEVVMISTNNVKVGGVNQMTGTALSSVIINTPYGNNIYNAGLQMPYIAHGWSTLGVGGGSQSLEITLPFTYDEHLKPFDVQVSYRNGVDNTPLYWSTTTTGSSFWVFGGSGQEFSWTTFGDLPFTG